MKIEICKCDRCGKMIYGDDESKKVAEDLPVIVKNIEIMRGYSLYEQVELCYACQKELYKWCRGREWVEMKRC